MSIGDPEMSPSRISERARRESVQWFSILHGPDRTPDADLIFRKWYEASDENQAAYDLVTAIWDRTGELPKPPLLLPKKWQRAGFRSGFRRAVATVAAVTITVVVGLYLYVQSEGIHTAVGEQRVVQLDDGTRISLNTDTQLVVNYDATHRSVSLKKGEALFEVAKDPDRPFVVSANGRSVTALGTVFLVRNVAERFAVTLVEGRVSVSPEEPSGAKDDRLDGQTLMPGERLTIDARVAPRLDRPEVAKVMAWRQGRVEMDQTPLYEAVVEMNRYSDVKLKVEQPEAQVLPVTGSFRTGDNANFASMMVQACHLEVEHRPQEIVLKGKPSDNCR